MANKRKKNLGKVKRYRHNYQSKKSTVLNVVLWVSLVVVALAGGYFVAPTVIDFGTSTWYSLTSGITGFRSEPEVVPEETPEPTPIATPDATPIAEQGVVDGSWAQVSLSALTTPELIAQTINELSAQGVTYVEVTLKDTAGYIHYASSIEAASSSIAATCIDAQAVATAITEAGMIPVASIAAFQDPISVYQDKSLAIGYIGTDYRWLDNTAEAGGKAWMNPYADASVTFIGDIISEVSAMGYSHVVLGQVQFPKQVSTSQDYGDIGDATRADALRSAIAAWDARFAESDVTLWYSYDYETYLTESTITGELPSTLGITNAIVVLPLASEEDPNPDVSSLDAVVAAQKASGSAYVVVQDGDVADFS